MTSDTRVDVTFAAVVAVLVVILIIAAYSIGSGDKFNQVFSQCSTIGRVAINSTKFIECSIVKIEETQ